MYYYLIAPTVIARKDQHAFTYHSQTKLRIGELVRVSIGKKQVNGIVLNMTQKPAFPTKAITQALANKPLPYQLIKLALWLSDYYATQLPTVLQTLLPAGLHKKRRQSTNTPLYAVRRRTNIVLNHEQLFALKIINKQVSGAVMLHGITGSGKTQVYIEAARHTQQLGLSSIILVPEIALTPQLVAEFANHFSTIVVTHSHMSESQRDQAWRRVLDATDPVVVIGPRSALFMPVGSLGLIVIDECHEPSFKQEQSPRYSALRAASVLARLHEAKVIFGSATPSVADFYLAQKNKSPIVTLHQTARPTTEPNVHLIDTKNRDNFREHRFISDTLMKTIRNSLAAHKQIMIFHNRRGTSPTTLCSQCGWTSLCNNCYVPMTLHADQHTLLCHICGRRSAVPPSCPVCQFPDIVFKGIGTKLVESEMKKLFPKARLARFDADNAADETLAVRYQQLYDGKIDIMIGTQLLTKGLDLPYLAAVGIIQADSGLQLPDYSADERVFQLLYQVAGRVGRGAGKSHVVVQTYQPNHPIIQLALKRDYSAFYTQQLEQRRRAHFPPFVYLLKLVCTYKTEAGAIRAAQVMAKQIKETWPDVTVLGPTPAFYERLGGNYRWQLLVKSTKRQTLTTITTHMPAYWQHDLDPVNLL